MVAVVYTEEQRMCIMKTINGFLIYDTKLRCGHGLFYDISIVLKANT
jgi:hypothetical protein